jgi:hypothetical protein
VRQQPDRQICRVDTEGTCIYDATMTEGYSEFLAEHRAEHGSAFNRWCLVVGDFLQIAGVLAGVRGRWKPGLTMTAAGLAVVVAGHARDGNVPKSLDTARRHPIWNVRGDLAIAKDMLVPSA